MANRLEQGGALSGVINALFGAREAEAETAAESRKRQGELQDAISLLQIKAEIDSESARRKEQSDLRNQIMKDQAALVKALAGNETFMSQFGSPEEGLQALTQIAGQLATSQGQQDLVPDPNDPTQLADIVSRGEAEPFADVLGEGEEAKPVKSPEATDIGRGLSLALGSEPLLGAESLAQPFQRFGQEQNLTTGGIDRALGVALGTSPLTEQAGISGDINQFLRQTLPSVKDKLAMLVGGIFGAK